MSVSVQLNMQVSQPNMFSRLIQSAWNTTIGMTMQVVGSVWNVFGGEEKEALLKQNEELRTQLQQAQQHMSCQEQMIKQLSDYLGSEEDENHKLWDQVEYLTSELNSANSNATYHLDLFKRERAKHIEEQDHRIKLQQQMSILEAQLFDRETSIRDASDGLDCLAQSHEEASQRYEALLRGEKERGDLLQQQLEDERWSQHERRVNLEVIIENQVAEKRALEHNNNVLRQQLETARSCAEQVLEHQEEIQRLRAERDALQQKIDHDEEWKRRAQRTYAKRILKLKAERSLQQEGEEQRSSVGAPIPPKRAKF